jgi:hypothetical protein
MSDFSEQEPSGEAFLTKTDKEVIRECHTLAPEDIKSPDDIFFNEVRRRAALKRLSDLRLKQFLEGTHPEANRRRIND